MGAIRTVFVGREDELASLSGALRGALTAGPQIVWVEGEPGIGKTALLRQFLSTTDGAAVLAAGGDESEVALEYGVVSQLVSSGAAGPPPAPGTGAAQRSVFSVGAELLSMLGAQRATPTIVAIDDAHWLDLPSAGALLFALRRLQVDHVLVLVLSRPGGLDRLGGSWPRLLGDPERVQHISLAGLTGPDVGELASSLGLGTITHAVGERLRGHTRGHPLYLRSLLSELPPDALTFADGPLPAPRSFSATVLARLAKTGAAAQDLVAAAAVAGPRCRLALAASAAGLPDPSAALAQARSADLVSLVPGRLPEELAFTHPLIRAAVYDDLSPSRRRALHLRYAELGGGEMSLTHRVAASPGADDALTLELIAAAQREVAAGALSTGAEQLLRASRIAASPQLGDQALLGAAECLMLAGDVPAAYGLRDRVAACAEGPLKSFVVGALTAATGRLAEAESLLRAVTEHPDLAAGSELAGRVTSSLAIVCAYLGRGDEAIAWAQEALRATGNPATVGVTARQALTMGLALSGRGHEAIALLDSLSATRLHPEPFEAELLATRGNLKAWCGDLPGALEDLSAVIAWSRAGSPLRSLPNAYGALAQTEYQLGRWEEGLTHADLAVSLGEDTDRAWDLPFVHAVAAQLHAGRGDWAAATQRVESARRAAQAAPLPLSVFYACLAAAHLAWVRREWSELLHSLTPLRERSIDHVGAILGPHPWGLLEAEAMLGLGRLPDAARVLDMLHETIADRASEVHRAELFRLDGALALARDRPAEADAALERGREAAHRAGSLPARAALELASGHLLRVTGDRRGAIAALRDARARVEGLGARPFLARCDAELAACGVRTRARDANNRYGLTAREQVVARLVAGGKSNREAAEELYLSTKAIEYHLSNVFAKVNVRSRHQLAGALADSD